MTCADPFGRPPNSSSRLRVPAEQCPERVDPWSATCSSPRVAAYLLWCLFSSLTGVLGPDEDGATEY